MLGLHLNQLNLDTSKMTDFNVRPVTAVCPLLVLCLSVHLDVYFCTVNDEYEPYLMISMNSVVCEATEHLPTCGLHTCLEANPV